MTKIIVEVEVPESKGKFCQNCEQMSVGGESGYEYECTVFKKILSGSDWKMDFERCPECIEAAKRAEDKKHG